MTDYQKQAIDFLNATSTAFTAKFEKFDYYFQEDKHKRNIFKITLQNKLHKYSFTFGTSLNDSLQNCNDVIYEDTIDFYCGFKFEGLAKEYLSVSHSIKIEDIKKEWEKDKSNFLSLIPVNKIDKEFYEWQTKNTIKSPQYGQPVRPKFTIQEFKDAIIQKLIKKGSELKAKNWGEGIAKDTPIAPDAYDVLASLTKYEVNTFDDFCSEFGYDNDSRKAFKTYKAVKREWENVKLLWSGEQLEQLREIN